jgi:hypothetical protein
MASTQVHVTITVDSTGLTKTTRTFLETAIAAAIEPAVKRELKKALAELNESVQS